MKATYAIWRDYRTGTYEVVRWENLHHIVVETNIKTMNKAKAAADTWRQMECEREQNRRQHLPDGLEKAHTGSRCIRTIPDQEN